MELQQPTTDPPSISQRNAAVRKDLLLLIGLLAERIAKALRQRAQKRSSRRP